MMQVTQDANEKVWSTIASWSAGGVGTLKVDPAKTRSRLSYLPLADDALGEAVWKVCADGEEYLSPRSPASPAKPLRVDRGELLLRRAMSRFVNKALASG